MFLARMKPPPASPWCLLPFKILSLDMHEEHREALFEASKQGKLLNLPLPVSNSSDLWHLPGYVSLHPELNLAGFEFAWQTLFLVTMNVLAFEECSKLNIGALETALRMFETSGYSTLPHPLRQRDDESTTNWAARVTVHLRWTKAACIEAGCPERCPNEIQLKLLTFILTCSTIGLNRKSISSSSSSCDSSSLIKF